MPAARPGKAGAGLLFLASGFSEPDSMYPAYLPVALGVQDRREPLGGQIAPHTSAS